MNLIFALSKYPAGVRGCKTPAADGWSRRRAC